MSTQIEDIKYDDLEYCHHLLSALNHLEQIKERRTFLKEKIQKKVILKIGLFSLLSYFFVPFLTLILIILNHEKEGGSKIQFLVLGLGIVVYVGVITCWKTWGEKRIISQSEMLFREELLQLEQSSRTILKQEIFRHPRLPKKYLTPTIISQLINYLEKNHANFLEEAIYMMEMDIRNSKYGKSKKYS